MNNTEKDIEFYSHIYGGNKKKTEVKRRLKLMELPGTLKFRVRLCSLLDGFGIQTTEQLVTYNKFAFWAGGNKKSRGDYCLKWQDAITPKEYSTLQECLRKIGLDFASEVPTKTQPPFFVIGSNNVKQYLAEALERVTDPEVFLSDKGVSYEATRMLVEITPKRLDNEENNQSVLNSNFYEECLRDYYRRAFLTTYTAPLLEELAEEGKIKRIYADSKPFYQRHLR